MGVDSQAIIEAVASHAMAIGYFDAVNQFEPKSSPGYGLAAAVWVQTLRPFAAQSGLAATSARLVLNVRIYTNMLAEPQDMIDPNLMDAVDKLMTAYSGDFSLDGLVSHVDLLGQGGDGLGGEAGYVDIDKTLFRIFTLTVPVVVNNAYPQAA